MIYTPKIQKAISFAAKAHAEQKRKSGNIPYIIHPLSVALIIARTGADEDTIAAALLHDVIEDCAVSIEQIKEEFGEKTAKIVDDLTEYDKSLPWEERKRLALEYVSKMSRESLLVKSADVLHNMSDLIYDYGLRGDLVFQSFEATKDKYLRRFDKFIKAAEEAWSDNPLMPDLKKKFDDFCRICE